MGSKILLGVSLLLAGSVLAAQSALTITIGTEVLSLTTNEFSSINAALPRINAESRVDETPFTVETLLKSEFEKVIATFSGQGEIDDQANACANWTTLTVAEQQSAIINLFGGATPCITP